MFRELADHLPNERATLWLAVRWEDAGKKHLVVTLHPQADLPEDMPAIGDLALRGTPDELDQPLDLSAYEAEARPLRQSPSAPASAEDQHQKKLEDLRARIAAKLALKLGK